MKELLNDIPDWDGGCYEDDDLENILRRFAEQHPKDPISKLIRETDTVLLSSVSGHPEIRNIMHWVHLARINYTTVELYFEGQTDIMGFEPAPKHLVPRMVIPKES